MATVRKTKKKRAVQSTVKKLGMVRSSHYLLDFFGCNPEQLNSMSFWNEHLVGAVKAARMEILAHKTHQFEPFGITAFLLLSTSHISIHTWPEHNYVACDVFSCGPDKDTRKAVAYLKKHIQHTDCDEKFAGRGYAV